MMEHDHNGLRAVESYGRDPFLGGGERRDALGLVADIYFYVAVGLGLIGVPMLARRVHPRRLFFLFAMLTLAMLPLLFFGTPRFHVPVIPLLVVPAGWVLINLWGLQRQLLSSPESNESDGTARRN